MTMQTAVTATRKMMEFAADAAKCTAPLSPQVQRMLSNLEAKAEKTHRTKVEVLRGTTMCGHVYPRIDQGNISYLCNLTTKSCACGMTALTGFPCLCMAILVKAIPHAQLLPLVAEQDTAAFWKKQYSFDFASCMLSKANVWCGRATPLNLPGAIPKKAGRPSTSRKKSKIERAAGRVPAGAEHRPRKVYNCKKCGLPKKGHTCRPQGGAN